MKILLACAVLATVALQSIASPSRAEWTVEGMDVGWTMVVKEGWYGGNFEQVSQRIQRAQRAGEPPDSLFMQTFRALKEEARGLDAVLMKIEPTLEIRATFVRVRVMAPSTADAVMGVGVEEFLRVFGMTLRSEDPSATVTRLGTRKLTIGGRFARTTQFKVAIAGQASSRIAVYAVIAPKFGHVFTLSSQESVADARISAFEGMLPSLRYK